MYPAGKGLLHALGLLHFYNHLPIAAELFDRLVFPLRVQGRAVEAVQVLDKRDALALHGLGDDKGRRVLVVYRLRIGVVYRFEVVAVYLDGLPAEGFCPFGVGVAVPAVHRLPGLPQAVHVQHGYEVAQLVVRSVLEGLPHGAFGHLGVAAQDVGAGVQLVKVFARQREADPEGEPLAQGAGGYVNPRYAGGRVSFVDAVEAAEAHEVFFGDGPGGLVDRVQERRGVAFGEDQAVVGRVLRRVEVVAQVLAHQHRHEVRRRHRGRGVPGPCGPTGADAVHP